MYYHIILYKASLPFLVNPHFLSINTSDFILLFIFNYKDLICMLKVKHEVPNYEFT